MAQIPEKVIGSIFANVHVRIRFSNSALTGRRSDWIAGHAQSRLRRWWSRYLITYTKNAKTKKTVTIDIFIIHVRFRT